MDTGGPSLAGVEAPPRACRLFDTLDVVRQQVGTDEGARVRGRIRDTTIAGLETELGVDLGGGVARAHDGGLLIVADDVVPRMSTRSTHWAGGS